MRAQGGIGLGCLALQAAALLVLHGSCAPEDDTLRPDPVVIGDRDIWFVNAGASGVCDGSSWSDAFTILQTAVDYASRGDMIWVAEGTYRSPIPGDPSTPVVRMKPGVDLFGGFSISDDSLSQRDPGTREVILDGSNTAWHVVIGADSARLDGFTVMSGHADGDYPDNCGAGMLNEGVSPSVENCIFTANDAEYLGAGMCNISAFPEVSDCIFRLNLAINNGAGVYNGDESSAGGTAVFRRCTFGPANACRFGAGIYNNWCEVVVEDCVILDNTANHNGGGMYNTCARTIVRNSVFEGNRAYEGGAVYCNGIAGADSTNLGNCLLAGNTAYVKGGGVYLLNSSSTIINCTLADNYASGGGGISCWGSETDIVNCVVWGNNAGFSDPAIEIGVEPVPSVRYCDVGQDGYGDPADGSPDAFGNIRLDPLFTVGTLGDWYLSHLAAGQEADSPCVDAGISTILSALLLGLTTTRTDGTADTGRDDMGFHYPVAR